MHRNAVRPLSEFRVTGRHPVIAIRYPIKAFAMEQFDFVCDEDLVSLRILQRNPADLAAPVEQIRVHILCSDCVAGLDVDAVAWAGFVALFEHDYVDQRSGGWLSPAGEWKLMIEKDDHGVFTFLSELDSLHDFHRWKLATTFKMSQQRFRQTAAGVLEFMGAWR